MSDNIARLRKVLDIAGEASSDKRRELLREVTDLFLGSPDSYNEREVGHFTDIMMRVARAMETKVRQELAERMAKEASAPHDLVTMLANDAIEVARPILLHSVVLEDGDLLDVIRRHGQEHMQAISGRAQISGTVVDALVDKGDDTVLQTLVGNQGAEISRRAMEKIVVRAERNERLHEPLVGRKDVPPELLNEVFWFVSSSLRQHIMQSTAAIEPSAVDRMLEETRSTVLDAMQVDQANVSQAERFIINKKRLGQLDEALLVGLLGERRYREFIFGLAHLVEVDIRTAQRIFYDPGREALAIACRAKNFSRESFAVLLSHAKYGGVPFGDEDEKELMALYDAMTHDTAQRTMRFWRVREASAKLAASASQPAPAFARAV